MKKVLLGMLFCTSALAVTAQRVENLQKLPVDKSSKMVPMPEPAMKKNSGSMSKKDDVGAWYSFPNALNSVYNNGEIVAFAPYMFIDTTVMFASFDETTQQFSTDTVRYNSVGACFDPKDEIFELDELEGTETFSKYNKYTVDSVGFTYLYKREVEEVNGVPVVDTLVIQVFKGANVEDWYIGQQSNPDERFGTVQFDIKTGLAKGAFATIKRPLTSADTTWSRFGVLSIPLTNFGAAAGQEMAAIFTYIPGQAYTRGDTLAGSTLPSVKNPVNGFRFLMMPDQAQTPVTTYNNGLIVQYQQRHNPQFLMAPTVTARYLASTAFNTPLYPDVQFHISATSVGVEENDAFKGYGVGSIYPNPATGIANLQFELGKSENVTIDIYNVVGQKVSTVANDAYAAGKHNVSFSVENLNSGVYFYTINAGGYNKTMKFTVVK
jgi:hypothetical protein